MLLLAAAAGLLQAGVIDQSLFSVGYRGLDTWAAWQTATLIPGLGVSAHMVLAFVGGHVAYSFAAPIALVEALAPERRTEPWLGVGGLVVAGLAYAAAATLVLIDHLRTEASHASGGQVAGCLIVAAALIAWGLRRRASPPLDQGRRAPRPITIGVVAFVVASLQAVVPETWLATGLSLVAIVAAGAWVARASRTAGWHVRQVTALATGVLLSRAVLAFTYVPLFGDVSPGRKYAHNVVMAAVIVGMAALAARAARRHYAPPAA